MKDEIWRPVIGYEGSYEVSNTGRVRSHNYLNKKITIIRCVSDNGNGYGRITLYKHNVGSRKYIHRLVAEAFIPNPENKTQVDHIDGDPSHNWVENLRWCSNRENSNYELTRRNRSEHSFQRGRFGKLNYQAKPILQLLDGVVIKEWECAQMASRELDINYRNISSCAYGRRKTAGGFGWSFKE